MKVRLHRAGHRAAAKHNRLRNLVLVLGLGLLGTVSLPAGALETAWVLTTDYGTFGRVRAFAMDSPWTVTADLATIPGDPAGRHHDDLVYVVGRSSANLIQIYDPAAGFSLVREFSLGSGLNPQDIAFDARGDAYVSCYDQAVLLRVDISSGLILDSFDTSSFADADGLPETAWLQTLGDRLYITCQKLDRNYYYAPSGPGALLVFDMEAEQWVDMDPVEPGIQPIELQGGAPYTRIEVYRHGAEGPTLRVGCVGFYGLQDGGLEQVDPVAGVSLGYLVTEAQLGGDIIGFTGTRAGSAHVLVSDSSFDTSLRRVNLVTGQVTVLDSAHGYFHADVAYDGGFQLYLADRTLGASGLRVFDTVSGAELTAGPLPTGLPPFQFVLPFNGGFTPVTGPVPTAGRLRLAAACPNPCNPRSTLKVSGSPGSRVQVQVLDLRGRRLLRDSLLLDAAGSALFRFEGRDQAGRDLPAGLYRVTTQGREGFAARSVILLK
ncbi:MAG: hypothetical protein E4H23_12900 [Chrysiogenales bacterium]|nr:MAG: hypothetical protein E4H23_12900 [Chrysiogenales bacterium]